MNQSDLVAIVSDSPANYAWFLGAGASRTAGLPTSADLIWDLKRRHYCREENQDIARQDLQNDAVRERIQSYFDSRGFPPLGDDDEYSAYFEQIFGEDKERQRRYIRAVLSEDQVSLSIGSRVFGALISSGLTRIAFTTNFDTVVEKAVAEMGHRSISAYHLEGSRSANAALNNEEFPLYCKLHGDFRYDSLKNLSADLEQQNDDLARCLVNAGGRFGFVVAGYSGRDDSVMQVFHRVLGGQNPFPHGLYWTVMKGSTAPPSVLRLIERAAAEGVEAYVVETPTFDAFMLHLWRNIDNKPQDLDARVRKSRMATVDIPLPRPGKFGPLVRLTGLPIVSLPERCHAFEFTAPKEWQDLRDATAESKGGLILTKGESIWGWGARQTARLTFGKDLVSIVEAEVPTTLRAPGNLHVKGFIERALSMSVARGRPLVTRTRGRSGYAIADLRADSHADLEPLSSVVGRTGGFVSGLSTSPTPEFPKTERVRWSEALRITVTERNGQLWLLIHPDLWIWPPRARRDAQEFMDRRRRDRLNRKYNELLDAWIEVVLGPRRRGDVVEVSPFDTGDEIENPKFLIGRRTAYTRRLSR